MGFSMFALWLCILTMTVAALPMVRPFPRPYDERIAKRMIPLAVAAYTPMPQLCLSNRFRNATIVKRIEVPCDPLPNDTCSGYLALIHDFKAVALVFRGTTTAEQLELETLETLYEKPDFLGLGGVHEYFHDAFFAVWRDGGMEEAFVQTIRQYPDYKLWITGHSLGAAMSTLASVLTTRKYGFNEFNVEHYNYGSPRVGNATFAANVRKLVPNFWRITHSQDFVTANPPPLYEFAHHSLEVWYNNNMLPGSKYIICLPEDDSRCKGKERDSWVDHSLYFGVQFQAYAMSGCRTPVP